MTIDCLCETARDIVKGIAGAPAHLVAHSMGTLVAQHLAVAASEWVASLTLFGPIGEPATPRANACGTGRRLRGGAA